MDGKSLLVAVLLSESQHGSRRSTPVTGSHHSPNLPHPRRRSWIRLALLGCLKLQKLERDPLPRRMTHAEGRLETAQVYITRSSSSSPSESEEEAGTYEPTTSRDDHTGQSSMTVPPLLESPPYSTTRRASNPRAHQGPVASVNLDPSRVNHSPIFGRPERWLRCRNR